MKTTLPGHTIFQAAFLLLITLISITSFANTQTQANVLFIAIDDLRVQYGAYDIDQALTPNIDQLAAEGIAFGRAYSNVPICGASRASMLTGIRPTRNRFVTFEYASKQTPWATTLPQHFKENGYYSISLGKVFNNPGDKAESWSEPEWRPNATASEPGVVDNKLAMGRHNYVSEEALAIARTGKKAHLAFEKADVDDDAYYNGQIAKRAIADLKRLKEMDKPFFLAVGLVKPHLPFNAPERYWDMYDAEKIQLTATPEMPKDAPPQTQHEWGELRNYGHNGQMPRKGTKDLMPDDLARQLIHGYYAATSYSDALVGNIMAELEELGLTDNTIVVLWGDHGWSLGEHSQWAKHSSFNVANQIPLILKVPGMPTKVRGSLANGLVESIDIYPTLVELAGLSTPGHVQGKSFRKQLEDPAAAGKDAVFPRWRSADSIRTDQYFYTEWRNDEGEVVANMLFDHFDDPTETINLAADESHAAVTEKLHGQLTAHIQSLAAESNLVAGELEIIGDDFKFTEGPATDAEGNVYFTDVRAEKIYTWSTDGELKLFRENTGGANGLYFNQTGNLYACEGLNRRVTFISPDGTIKVLADEYNGKAFNKPNDLWIDPKGGVYFTDPAYGKIEKKQDGEHVYYLLPDRSKVIRVIDDLARPNGIIGTADGKTLYVANPAEKEIWQYSIKPDASLGNKTLFASVLCDGMTLDERGNLYTTPETVQIFSPKGILIEEIKTPNRPTNVTFGGKNNRSLFITARTHVYTVEMNVSGMD